MEVLKNQGATDGSGPVTTMDAAWRQLAALLNQDQRWHDGVIAKSDQKRPLRPAGNETVPSLVAAILTNE